MERTLNTPGVIGTRTVDDYASFGNLFLDDGIIFKTPLDEADVRVHLLELFLPFGSGIAKKGNNMELGKLLIQQHQKLRAKVTSGS